ncbi:GerAB/ArcD/ProY family transporter [Paenibacillus sp. LMG 31460]|uniref:GerAB/ArcD/ProY family transporter n=1 Tax=Paenibacillus germinis TaxID=2654979 RepID=A0ABX1YZC6_9BACL|nr:GerAB/ArcD/ProY family transporter [Paenibacillus germinis]NOU85509.1 GerAB/ArcD/ProY family transporter [Paenibacillus germinis]
MITNHKEQITTTQASLMVSKSMIGTGILILPQGLSKEVGTPDGWISVIVSGLLALLAGYIIVKLSQRFPKQTFYQYSQTVAGKLLGRSASIVLTLYYIVCSGYLLRFMGEVIRMYLLDNTPLEVIMIVFLSLAAYLTVGGINPIARLTELFLPVVVFLLLVFIVFSLGGFEIDNIRPVLGDGMLPVLKGIKPSIFSYSGTEIMLILPAFMIEPRKAVKASLMGIALVIPLYTLVVVIAIATLTVDEVKTVAWPMMSVAKTIELPGGFFERFESLFSVLWVISMYSAFVIYQYAASLGCGQLFRKEHRTFIYACLPVIYLIAMFPADLNSLFKFGDFLGYSALFIAAIMPPCFLIIAKLRRKGLESR